MVQKTKECQKNECQKKATSICDYCHKGFCSEHIKAYSPSMPSLNSILYTSPQITGHPCPAYPVNSSVESIAPLYIPKSVVENTNRKKIIIALLILVILAVFLYYLYYTHSLILINIPKQGILNTATNFTSVSQISSSVSICTFEVNIVINTLQAKEPSGTNITIVNTYTFPYNQNISVILQKATAWAKQWSSYYVSSGNLPNYVISDAGYVGLSASAENITSLGGVGEAIKISLPAVYVNTRLGIGTSLWPLLCSANGQIESGSANLSNYV